MTKIMIDDVMARTIIIWSCGNDIDIKNNNNSNGWKSHTSNSNNRKKVVDNNNYNNVSK